MKLSPASKAIIVVLALGALLGYLWLVYSESLTQGSQPPESTQILNKLEKDGVPNFSFELLSGGRKSLSDFAGKLVILNFWASWCDPCIAEFPSLLKLVDKFEGEILLLAVSADYEEADIHTFLRTFNLNHPNIYVSWDKDYNLAKRFGTYKLPESYIIGRDGRLIRKVSGVDDWSNPEAFEFFSHLLSK